jgi:molybdenum cofactor guanylyltransferase
VSTPRVAGLILAGGASSRMIIDSVQTDKAWVHWQGRPLIKHAIARLEIQVNQVLINASPNETTKASYDELNLELLADVTTGKQGPLAGILAGLIYCKINDIADWLQVVPCDAPNAPLTLVEKLLGIDEQPSPSIRIPIDTNGQKQPMFALIPLDAIDALQMYFDSGRRSLLEFANALGPVSKEPNETNGAHTPLLSKFIRFDESPQSNFANVNSLGDLDQLT